jgi:hypothetical protein
MNFSVRISVPDAQAPLLIVNYYLRDQQCGDKPFRKAILPSTLNNFKAA